MGLVDHAKGELKTMLEAPEEYDRAIATDVLKLIEVFAEQGHSGFSAPIVSDLFYTLAAYKPLGPLTGADDEWFEVTDPVPGGMQFQNRRCSRVFKDSDGKTYDIDGFVFEEPDGSRWTGFESRRPVTFPYVPLTEIVKVAAERTEDGKVIRL